MRAFPATLGVALVLVVGSPLPGGRLAAQAPPTQPGHERPKLVVILSVDQFRRDYYDRYGKRWTGGLARLFRDGASFPDAAYPYFHTITCAGHATMSTGDFPVHAGLPLNAWWDKETRRDVACTDDPGVQNIGHRPGIVKQPAGGNSAHMLRVPAFADVLRGEVTPIPRVVTLSMKPRAAIMLAGHAGDAVIWYTPEGGATTSTFYASKPIPFIAKFSQMNPTKEELSGEWTRMLPASSYEHEDDGPGEHPPDGWTTQFPHALQGTRSDGREVSYWQNTPNADAWLGRLARAAVDELKLGRTQLDYLAISFSTLDTSGHAFGPDSHEVQDVLLRLDRTIGDLLDALDDKVGKGRYVVALTGDHGVAPLPERRRAEGEDAGRINLKPMAIEIDAALSARWGKATYVGKVVYTDIYFEKGIYERLEKDAAAMTEVTDIVRKTPGVAAVFRRDQILAAAAPADDAALIALRLSYVPDRSGDLILLPRPYWMTAAADGTTHGTPQLYDRQVPLVLYGFGVKPGTYPGPASPADIAPTFGAIVGIKMPKTDGTVLKDALAAPVTASAGTP
jgi:predicted AlkP superfamily pyrophosphatase or phosphodiesterase